VPGACSAGLGGGNCHFARLASIRS